MSLAIYDPDRVQFLFAMVPVKGYADGTFINVETQEQFTVKVGADGTVTRTKTNNKVARVKITLMAASPSNDVLSAIHVLDVESPNGSGVASLAIKDLSGRFVFLATEAWIAKPPNVEFAREGGQREWEFDAIVEKRFDGGS
jgi:hypothetical protein